MQNHYNTLGVDKDSSIIEIKTAYRKLSKKFHPDVNDGDPFFHKMFLKIQTAYEVLSDEKQRAIYDRQWNELSSYSQQNSSSLVPKIINFSVNVTEVRPGEVFTVSWEVENADVVEIKPFGKFNSFGVESFVFHQMKYPLINLILIATNSNNNASTRQVVTLENSAYKQNFFQNYLTNNGILVFILRLIVILGILAFIFALFFIGIKVQDPLENYTGN